MLYGLMSTTQLVQQKVGWIFITVYGKYFQVCHKFKEIHQLENGPIGIEFPNIGVVNQITKAQ